MTRLQQQPLFIATADLPRTVAHPFNAKPDDVLAQVVRRICRGTLRQVLCQTLGRPSLTPGKYLCLLLGCYSVGIDFEKP